MDEPGTAPRSKAGAEFHASTRTTRKASVTALRIATSIRRISPMPMISSRSELLRAVRARDGHGALVILPLDAKEPGIAANLAVLHEAAPDVSLEAHVHVLSAVGAGDDEVLFHSACPAALWPPLKPGERDAPAFVEAHALALEPETLQDVHRPSTGARADLSP